MDYKFIILLVILLGLIFLIVKEMGSVKEELTNTDERMRRSFSTLDNKIQMGFNGCVEKIKLANGHFMVQVRKMSNIEDQTILPTASNGYSDSESIKKSNPEEIIYLTEADDCKRVKTSKPLQKVLTGGQDKFQINLPHATDSHHQGTADCLPNIASVQAKVSDCVKLTDSAKRHTDKEKVISATEKNNDQKNVLLHDTAPANDTYSEKANVKHYATSSNDEESTDESDDKSDDESSNEESDEESYEESSEEDSDGDTLDVNSELVNVENTKKSSNNEEHKSSNNLAITLESSKKNKDPDNADELSEGESVATVEIALTLQTLKAIDEYNKSYLEKVAKKFSIPITCREGTRDGTAIRRQLKKEELYDKIKEKLKESTA